MVESCDARNSFAATPQPLVYCAGRTVTLEDGRELSIDSLSLPELIALQCEQEPAFALKIKSTPKNSLERAAVVQQAYSTICSILDEVAKRSSHDETFSMGMDPRYADLVLRILKQQQRRGVTGGLFELGCSAGGLLSTACRAGYRVGGLEVVPELLEQTRQRITAENRSNLFLGDFRSLDLSHQHSSYSVCYWNDVFEHIPQDEIAEYVAGLFALLKPGGVLITITPNWHMRPSDVTNLFLPRRSEAIGFHLKEYTLREVRKLLEQAGFTRILTPCFISRAKICMNSWLSLTGLKCGLEPSLEWMPTWMAVQACRRFGLSCTVARKPIN